MNTNLRKHLYYNVHIPTHMQDSCLPNSKQQLKDLIWRRNRQIDCDSRLPLSTIFLLLCCKRNARNTLLWFLSLNRRLERISVHRFLESEMRLEDEHRINIRSPLSRPFSYNHLRSRIAMLKSRHLIYTCHSSEYSYTHALISITVTLTWPVTCGRAPGPRAVHRQPLGRGVAAAARLHL